MTLVTYALIGALAEDGKDIISLIRPFVVRCLPLDGKSASLSTVQAELSDRKGLSIPLHVIEAALNESIREDEVSRTGNPQRPHYMLTPTGQREAGRWHEEHDSEREMNALADEVTAFAARRGLLWDESRANSAITNTLVDVFMSVLRSLDGGSVSEISSAQREDWVVMQAFVQDAAERRPEPYRLVERVVRGSVVAAALGTGVITSDARQAAPFSGLEVFLDTNMLFPVLGIETAECVSAVHELIDLMRAAGMRLCVYDFTRQEFSTKLAGYRHYSPRYPSSRKVRGLYPLLYSLSWTQTDVDLTLARLDQTLSDMSIEVVETGISIFDDERYDDSELDALRQLEPQRRNHAENDYNDADAQERPHSTLIHDRAALDETYRRSRQRVFQLGDAGAIFVTAHFGLARYAYTANQHSKDRSVCPVVLDRLVTMNLWAIAPNSQLPLKVVMAAQARHVMIDEAVWRRVWELHDTHRGPGRPDKAATDREVFFYRAAERRALELPGPKAVTPEEVSGIETAAKQDAIEREQEDRRLAERVVSADQRGEDLQERLREAEETSQKDRRLREEANARAAIRDAERNRGLDHAAGCVVQGILCAAWFMLTLLLAYSATGRGQLFIGGFADATQVVMWIAVPCALFWPRLRDWITSRARHTFVEWLFSAPANEDAAEPKSNGAS